MKKFTALIRLAVIAITTVILLSSCGARTDVDVKAVLTELLPKAAEVNEIIWGDGLPTEGEINENLTTAQYLPVVSDQYKRLADIKAAVRRVYSAEYAAIIEENVLSNTDYSQARYAESIDGVLRMNVSTDPMALETVFDIDGAKVKSANPYMITVEIPYTVREREGKTTLLLIMEDGQWRFDGPAY